MSDQKCDNRVTNEDTGDLSTTIFCARADEHDEYVHGIVDQASQYLHLPHLPRATTTTLEEGGGPPLCHHPFHHAMMPEPIRRLPRPEASRLRSSLVVTSVSRILAELIQNSLDAGASRIDCWVTRSPGDIALWIEDDGSGMSAEDMERLGERYSECLDGAGLSLKPFATFTFLVLTFPDPTFLAFLSHLPFDLLFFHCLALAPQVIHTQCFLTPTLLNAAILTSSFEQELRPLGRQQRIWLSRRSTGIDCSHLLTEDYHPSRGLYHD